MSDNIYDDGIDGYNKQQPKKTHVLAEEVEAIRNEMHVFAGTMSAFKIDVPQTVMVEVSVEFQPGKFVKCGTARILGKDESLTSAHIELYRQCFNSLSELVS